jgi:hypothetical protein
MMALHSLTMPGKYSGKQTKGDVGLRVSRDIQGSVPVRTGDGLSNRLAQSLPSHACARVGALPVPKAPLRPPQPVPCCFPHASPVLQSGAGKQKMAPKGRSKQLISLRKSGAGEGIRTLDPNLGKFAFRRIISASAKDAVAGDHATASHALLTHC